jgi:hypothetical protein
LSSSFLRVDLFFGRQWWVGIAAAFYPPYKKGGGSASLPLFTHPTKVKN